ncbi:hypothetical protein ATO6_05405 [Oceanicola sp. 22II-s10i]|uniref:DUF3035 domain-containing protein n=1 Tax=Oceanicola sp. 22II-s10i TaxID=1317116 RepID=UPI000B51FAFA|nr:DUF3035 domain-containing protein [Oceanicola sp. 22II-s10i]OWU86271.1 hypothetical protein ATO6_05405 [Oceanicola sp. 22II-s10i]
MKAITAIIILALPLLAACTGEERDIRLRSFNTNTGGPEEFAILPTKPLEQPQSFRELPQPTPGGSNRTDLTPREDAVAALGGRPSAMQPTGVPASEGGLVNYASRQGRDPAIRETLREEDLAYRKRESLFAKIRLFRTDRYYPAYKKQSLKPVTTARTYRRSGYETPSFPPGR